MTPSKYHPGLGMIPCPNCLSTDVEESGDDIDGEVGCNICSLATPVCYGTEQAIRVWNNRLHIDQWVYDPEIIKDTCYII